MTSAELLKVVGQVAGIGGLGLGVLFLLYRDIIRKNIFPRLPAAEAYRLLRLITVAVWSIAVFGIVAWIFSGLTTGATAGSGGIAISGSVNNSPVISIGK